MLAFFVNSGKKSSDHDILAKLWSFEEDGVLPIIFKNIFVDPENQCSAFTGVDHIGGYIEVAELFSQHFCNSNEFDTKI